MTKGQIMPVLVAALFAAACGEDDGSTAVEPATGPTANVRFFNATTGMTGNGGFTTNGKFATGSGVGFNQSTSSCAKVTAGSTSFGFGAANAGGTALSGNALATLNDQSITAGGNYTMVATGSATSPQLYLLDNDLSGSMGANQAALRFVNLAPGPNPTPNVFNTFAGGLPPTGTLFASNIFVGTPTAFKTVTSGANPYMAMVGHVLSTRTDATLTLPAGTVNTVAIVPGTTSSGFQMVSIPRC